MTPALTPLDPYVSLREAARLILEHEIGTVTVIDCEPLAGPTNECDLLRSLQSNSPSGSVGCVSLCAPMLFAG